MLCISVDGLLELPTYGKEDESASSKSLDIPTSCCVKFTLLLLSSTRVPPTN